MDGSSPPSFTIPHHETSYSQQVNDPYYAAAGPQSISDVNRRPVSLIQDQPLLRTIDGEGNLKRQPTLKDVAGDRGKSYTAPAVDFSRGPVAVTQDERPKTIGDLAAANKHNSGIVGTPAYDEAKMPSTSDVRPINHSSGNPQGGYQYMSGPKSYNGDNFGRFTW